MAIKEKKIDILLDYYNNILQMIERGYNPEQVMMNLLQALEESHERQLYHTAGGKAR